MYKLDTMFSVEVKTNYLHRITFDPYSVVVKSSFYFPSFILYLQIPLVSVNYL